MCMKYLAVLLVGACVGTAAAAKAPQRPQPLALRQVLEQYHPQSVPAPRQLSAREREELRRLLREQAPPVPRRTHPPGS
jgi:hypothetical protein